MQALVASPALADSHVALSTTASSSTGDISFDDFAMVFETSDAPASNDSMCALYTYTCP
ncbi:MAG: hypothetical protein WC048_09945 [Rhizobium sp.]